MDYTTDSNTETSIVSDASTSTISLTSLEPGRRYSISIVGRSEHLPSEPVNSSIFLCKSLHQTTPHVILCLYSSTSQNQISHRGYYDYYNNLTEPVNQ